MKTGFMYWYPALYGSIVRCVYGKNFYSRYKVISDILPEHASVVDVCCGDCYISTFAKKKNIDYLGLDINPEFVKYALKRGINARVFNIKEDIVPRADYVIMQGSLYHFIPEHRPVIEKLFSSADKAVIISESAENIASSKNPIVSFFADLATSVDGKIFSHRFTKQELLYLFNMHNVSMVKEIQGGRDLVGVFFKDGKL